MRTDPCQERKGGKEEFVVRTLAEVGIELRTAPQLESLVEKYREKLKK